ncbi:hypothetical protein [Flagellimonas sp. CMM7]|uniref:hypothetical protein n=1 Tax=Flagellimonas sp. CMM7 TaxID=2654676 RepID=UPI0013D3D3DE|nr:hypothetical protein [Flagellimonas sp. CMM7]UII81085.1 hypothetical protein LV704_06105 [Flagellimonas sp. CMM7]
MACFWSCDKSDSVETYEELMPVVTTEEEEIPTKEDAVNATTASTEEEEIPTKEE